MTLPGRRGIAAYLPARQVKTALMDPARNSVGAFALALEAAQRRKLLRGLRRLKGRVEFELDLDDTRR